MEERLQKLMAQAGLGSRRACEELIEQGRVKVNGQVAKLGDKANPRTDTIEVNGNRLPRPEQKIYIMVNKPRNVISDEDDTGEGRTTVRDLVQVDAHLYPVGRLDKQSMGLVLLTNDGELAHRLTHPRYGHTKVYRVKLEGLIKPEHLLLWRKGVELDDGLTAPAKVDLVELAQKENVTWLRITMREGRKRQIRRVATLLGYNVLHLEREQLGPLHLGDLGLGKWRHLTAKEVDLLKKTAYWRESQLEKKQAQEKRNPNDRRPSKRRLNVGNPRRPGFKKKDA